ncbi:SusC/RagA family TonB-linked outer membrane protein [Aestuariibaculum suncheonense]|uniref:TonB-dependent receptor n=1 Tax=Aestuariibaculum suncheonense TaxID=1028745 RepID=A0A8J6QDI3_9FLAO|nr:TonB-dependent receptor [Aestuariibaculum suncheonense]MBD0835083.1 TonB-dependent receptor [Aestuariibaculum suncheonense]
MKKLRLLVIAILLCFSSISWAQDTVSGVVKDPNEVPIPGANIIIKGTRSGGSTDFDGNYSINANVGDVLVFSYVGYQTLEVAYKGGGTLDVVMQEDLAKLDEVVVVGYGTTKRSDLTGSVASMDAKQLEQTNKVDAVSALQGQAAGVVIQRTDNKPGSGGFNIRIRGASTINNNQTADQGGFTPGQNPLFIVDGIFVDDISFLNPADIERMDVLKDASATAIYGSRGSNGVVIVETKRGKKGKLRVNYSNYVGFKEAYNLPSIQDGSGYVEYLKDVVVGNQFASGNLNYRRDDVVLSDYLDGQELQNVADGVSTDWVDLMLVKGFQTNHSLNLSGGNDNTKYSTGMAYTEDNGTLEGEDYTRFNIRGSVSSDLTDWLNLSVNNYVTHAIQNTGSWEGFRSAYRLKPIGRPYNDDGTLRFFPTDKETQITNPLFEADNEFKETKFLQYIGDIALQIQPAKGLMLTTKFSPNLKYTRYGEYRGLYSKSVTGNPSNRRAQVNNFNYFSYSWDNIINYKFTKDVHNLEFTGVISRFMERSEGYYNQVRNFTTDEFKFYNLGAGLDIREVNSSFSKQQLESYTARVNYALMNKYLFTFTGRYDGASILAKGNKWAFFPSAAFAWKVIDEDFMKSQDFISNAKIRLSYGKTGNNGQGGGLGPLQSQSFLGSSATNWGDTPMSTLYITNLTNPDLKWEKTSEVNVGLDYGFLNNRINGSIDVYNRQNTDIIFYKSLPNVTGFPGIYDNIGASTNKGVEVALNTVNVDNGSFKWTTNFNFASNKNTIDELNGSDIYYNISGTNYIHRVGEPVGAIYDYVFDGVWQLDEATEADGYGQTPGQVRVKDLNGDGQITPDADRKVIGQAAPKWTGGVTSTMNYKNFDFTFFISTSQGNTVSSNFHNNLSFPYDGDPSRLFNGYKIGYWTPENATNEWYQPGNGGQYQHTMKYKDVSFTKVGFVTLGYSLPSSLLDKLKIEGLRIYTTVQNPFIFTKYDGWDPESAGRNSWGASYLSRTYMAGISLNF